MFGSFVSQRSAPVDRQRVSRGPSGVSVRISLERPPKFDFFLHKLEELVHRHRVNTRFPWRSLTCCVCLRALSVKHKFVLCQLQHSGSKFIPPLVHRETQLHDIDTRGHAPSFQLCAHINRGQFWESAAQLVGRFKCGDHPCGCVTLNLS